MISLRLSKRDFTDDRKDPRLRLKKPSDRLLPLQLNSFQARRRSAVEPLGDHKVHVQPYQDKLMLNSSCLPGPRRNSKPMACCNRCTDCQRRTSPALLCVCGCVCLPDRRLSRFICAGGYKGLGKHRKHWLEQRCSKLMNTNVGTPESLLSKSREVCVCVALRVCVCGCALAGGRHT